MPKTGLEALEKLNADPTIDMVLSDINMPKMDGLTLLQQLPGVDPNLRAVIISAYGDMDNIRTAMNRGAFDFVTKPIDFDDLKITISRTLEHLAEWREALSSRDQLVALQNELSIASQLQQSILPKTPPVNDKYEVSANMEPARNIGGDFYDYFTLDNQVALVVADVSDKGIPASMFMMSSRTALKGAAIGVRTPEMVVGEVNNQLHQDNPTFMFVTLIYALFNPDTGLFTYSTAGHDPPLLVSGEGTVTELPLTKGVALGGRPRHRLQPAYGYVGPRGHHRVVHRWGDRGHEREQRAVRYAAIDRSLQRPPPQQRLSSHRSGVRIRERVHR